MFGQHTFRHKSKRSLTALERGSNYQHVQTEVRVVICIGPVTKFTVITVAFESRF